MGELRHAIIQEASTVRVARGKHQGLDARLTCLRPLPHFYQNVNYAVKSSLLLTFLESVPDVSAKLKAPNTADEKFEDVVKSAQDAAVLVLVY